MIDFGRLGRDAGIGLIDRLHFKMLPKLYFADSLGDFLENKTEISIVPEFPAKCLDFLMPELIKPLLSSYLSAYIILHNLTYSELSNSPELASLSDISQEIQLPYHFSIPDSIKEQNIISGDKLHYSCVEFTPRRSFGRGEELRLYKVQKCALVKNPEISLGISIGFLPQLQFG